MDLSENPGVSGVLSHLNEQQRRAAMFCGRPLLIVAGAGTGKTQTLVHRVAWHILEGVDPGRILLLTFTRRAAAEMQRRVETVLGRLADAQLRDKGVRNLFFEAPSETPAEKVPDTFSVPSGGAARIWGGTFHAIASRLLRMYAKAIDLSPDFTIHDRGDSEDLMNVVRTDLGCAKSDKRFPKKGTCLSIYSRCVNSRERIDKVLAQHFPWCQDWRDQLAELFKAYVDRKQANAVLDYDDLLVYWHALLAAEEVGEAVRKRFDRILIDEYQDTNRLQSEIIYRLSPDGRGVTAVGDDAQSIYSFRAATVRNILEFPETYPDAEVVRLEQNYRSTQPILDATNHVIAQWKDRFEKNLWSDRAEGPKPTIVLCEDEDDEASFVASRILERREEGIDLMHQAVLFRASHHSMTLEAELQRRHIPFHKYGGLKFVETAHVKDLMSILRLAENPRDVVAGMRVLPLLPGIGPTKARQLMETLVQADGNFAAWNDWKPPSGSVTLFPQLVKMLAGLTTTDLDLPTQVNQVRTFYDPLLEDKYDGVEPRRRDLQQLEQIASRYESRRRLLQDIALEPPNSTQDLAGPPHLDDDYLVLSTIHSAKGLEWDSVYVVHVADGNIPSDMATKSSEEIDEELRLFYVALTRAKNRLYVLSPQRFFFSRVTSRHSYAQRTRFLPEAILACFDHEVTEAIGEMPGGEESRTTEMNIKESVRRSVDDLF